MKPAGWWQRKRRGMECTSTMLEILQRLHAAKESGFPFIPLPGVHKRTLNSLSNSDWIFVSPGLDGIRYKITERGERARRVFEQPPKRTDGICPTCCIRPKHILPGGKTYGYCIECEREYKNRMYHLGRQRIDPNRLCSCCHQRPLHKMSGGKLSTYCTECRHAKRKAEKRAQHDRDLARIHNGEILLCRECKQSPRAYTERYVRDRCPACQKKYMDRYNARRRGKAEA